MDVQPGLVAQLGSGGQAKAQFMHAVHGVKAEARKNCVSEEEEEEERVVNGW